MATLDNVSTLARQLDITFTDNGQSFDLDSKADAPLRLEGTFRKVQAGIDDAYGCLVRLQGNLSKLPSRK